MKALNGVEDSRSVPRLSSPLNGLAFPQSFVTEEPNNPDHPEVAGAVGVALVLVGAGLGAVAPADQTSVDPGIHTRGLVANLSKR